MSHFVVLVFGEDHEEKLEPFWELNLDQEEMKNDPRAKFHPQISIDRLEYEYGKWMTEEAASLQKALAEVTEEDSMDSDNLPEPTRYASAQDWVESWHGYSHDAETSSWGYYSNPDAVWDWYAMGGRWTGFLKLLEGKTGMLGREHYKDKPEEGFFDQARMGDIDWAWMSEKNRYPYGVITLDDEWRAVGEMGWWGESTDNMTKEAWKTQFDEFLKTIPGDTQVTVVDCHV